MLPLSQVWINKANAHKIVRQACTELEPDYKPAITYVVVQKRHHTRYSKKNVKIIPENQQYFSKWYHINIRFFPEDGHKYQKNNNALAGTVVDHGITLSPHLALTFLHCVFQKKFLHCVVSRYQPPH